VSKIIKGAIITFQNAFYTSPAHYRHRQSAWATDTLKLSQLWCLNSPSFSIATESRSWYSFCHPT